MPAAKRESIMNESVLREKAKHFAVRTLKLYEYLMLKKREYTVSKQIVRSGTAIGANVCEAQYAQSRADFISKMHIALKEAGETEFWLEVLRDSGYINAKLAGSLIEDCGEIVSILVSTLNTSKQNNQ